MFSELPKKRLHFAVIGPRSKDSDVRFEVADANASCICDKLPRCVAEVVVVVEIAPITLAPNRCPQGPRMRIFDVAGEAVVWSNRLCQLTIERGPGAQVL